ncbi:heme-binding protein [Mucisphaera sp.]|uniref:heme-binding protein n=1 Tax=Mucisphaera sp. TaxID=2913024 RepID=UPI003D119C10
MKLKLCLSAFAPLLAVGVLLVGCVQAEIEPVAEAEPEVVQPVHINDLETAAPADWEVLRVAGEPEHELSVMEGRTNKGDEADYYRAGKARISASLAEGYARPTVPGAMEIKHYKGYRQAMIETPGTDSGFWPLFQHISSREIAMTAPVVMTGRVAGEEQATSTMAFLYRSPDLGPTGPAERGVMVEDIEPMTVLAAGFMGRRAWSEIDTAREQLEGWLANQEDEHGSWVAAGEVQLLGYNGPDTPRRFQWWEVQIPVTWEPAETE